MQVPVQKAYHEDSHKTLPTNNAVKKIVDGIFDTEVSDATDSKLSAVNAQDAATGQVLGGKNSSPESLATQNASLRSQNTKLQESIRTFRAKHLALESTIQNKARDLQRADQRHKKDNKTIYNKVDDIHYIQTTINKLKEDNDALRTAATSKKGRTDRETAQPMSSFLSRLGYLLGWHNPEDKICESLPG